MEYIAVTFLTRQNRYDTMTYFRNKASGISRLGKLASAAPKAEEYFSYGMPYYYYKGRLVYFGLSKRHIGLYIPTSIIEEHKSELNDYETTKATIHFPLDKRLPIMLIKKLVKTRINKNNELDNKK